MEKSKEPHRVLQRVIRKIEKLAKAMTKYDWKDAEMDEWLNMVIRDCQLFDVSKARLSHLYRFGMYADGISYQRKSDEIASKISEMRAIEKNARRILDKLDSFAFDDEGELYIKENEVFYPNW